jgi:hypothetical protein
VTKLESEIKVNGRTHHFKRIRSLNRIDLGRYAVSTTIGHFIIEGGRALGGNPRDWFLEGGGWTKAIHCVSVLDALHCIDTM